MFNKSYDNDLPIIVVGAGSAGIYFVQKMFHNNPSVPIKIFGAESRKPYCREKLTQFLFGQMTEKDLRSDSKIPDSKHLQTFFNNRIEKIDAENSLVIDSNGEKHKYQKLILATGASPIIPSIEGIDLENVIPFRNLEDAEALLCRQISSRNTLIIGGGQTGLDTASAMKRHNTKVSIVEHRKRLMFNQLDDHVSVYLRLYLDDLDIDVYVETTVNKIIGKNNKVTHVLLDDGDTVECDTVIVSIGIKPNIELAQDANIKVSRGIIIDDYLQTNQPNIYAIGECTEHNGRVNGSVQPGLEQAKILAQNLTGRRSKTFTGSTPKMRFKVLDYPFLTIGENGDITEKRKVLLYRNIKRMTYRKLILKRGRLHGVIAAGEWNNGKQLEQSVKLKKYIWPWQRKSFLDTGDLH